jgi:hypothetical protein
VTARSVSLTIVAFLLGALAAGGIGVRVIREVKTADDATSLPPSNIAPEAGPEYFVDPAEAMALFPIEIPFTISEDAPVVDVGFGVTVELLGVTDGGSSTNVQLAVVTDDPNHTLLFVTGAGPGWLPAAYGDEDGRTVTLTWVGELPPGEIALRASGDVWLPIDDGFALSAGGAS